jgi:hypothetical protein
VLIDFASTSEEGESIVTAFSSLCSAASLFSQSVKDNNGGLSLLRRPLDRSLKTSEVEL